MSDRRDGASRRRSRGLTLVEVLIALAILGLVAASIVTLIGQSTRFIADQEEKMLAGMLADAAMVELLARRSALERGETEKARTFAGRNWKVKVSVEAAGFAGLVRLEAQVLRENGPQVLARALTVKSEAP
ncbi:MAG: type II secretion system minor pseudopilin GspI [Parvularculaceae bacterium]|nr:type II secretion system minor pseudopilin GspI [Parvularculaceae bacterium]